MRDKTAKLEENIKQYEKELRATEKSLKKIGESLGYDKIDTKVEDK